MPPPKEIPFLHAVRNDPNNDVPRLVYADWLDERGNPYGEFIRLQCEWSQLGEGARSEQLKGRMLSLWEDSPALSERFVRPLRESYPADYSDFQCSFSAHHSTCSFFCKGGHIRGTVARGFVDYLDTNAARLVRSTVAELLQWHPVRRVICSIDLPWTELLAADTGLHEVEVLRLNFHLSSAHRDFNNDVNFGRDTLQHLATETPWPRLQELAIEVWHQYPSLHPTDLQFLADSRQLPALRRVSIEFHTASDMMGDNTITAQETLTGLDRQVDCSVHDVTRYIGW